LAVSLLYIGVTDKRFFIMKTNYVPQPMDTSDIQLPEELNVLIEQMAKNVHEVWAQSRISQGWTYGKERSDALKQHPCLVPYEELPEVEKAYDRDTALGTLKLISKLGFKISKE
jgi:ryanodine receptor 2